MLYDRFQVSPRSKAGIFLLFAGLPLLLQAQTGTDEITVEEILRTQITSVGRKAQQVANAPAAVYVVTQEDIRRSGATNIPDLLRIVPGMIVGRINGSTWAISARGDARQYANKMLVLIDGRSVYSRAFSGVFWNAQDLLLEDIDRIEVIRGPGAVMWGSNAVNGVISIITKKSQATQGGLMTLGGGSDDRFMTGFRYGGSRGDRLAYRVWGKFNAREYRDAGGGLYRPSVDYSSSARALSRDTGMLADDGQLWRTGFRMDWEKSARDNLTVLGEVYAQRYPQTTWRLGRGAAIEQLRGTDAVQGGNVLARWSRSTSPGEETTVQFWADRSTQNTSIYKLWINMADAEVQHRRMLGENHELHLGGGYRRTVDSLRDSPFQFRQDHRSGALWNGVVRDEYQLFSQKLTLSAGIRGEHNGYTGFEFQPSVRLMFAPAKELAWWLAWSRAVRTPSRVESDTDMLPIGGMTINQMPILVQVLGNSQFRSERVAATEAGFRWQRRQHLSLDLALFFNRQSRLSSAELGELHVQTQPVLDIRQDVLFANGRLGRSRGAEISMSSVVRPGWRLQGSYSYLYSVTYQAPGTNGLEGRKDAMDPGHQAKLQSFLNLGKRWQSDVSLYGVGPTRSRGVPGYLRADARLSWRPVRNQDWSLVAQDVFNNGRLEWDPDLYIYAIPTRRAIVLRWTVQF